MCTQHNSKLNKEEGIKSCYAKKCKLARTNQSNKTVTVDNESQGQLLHSGFISSVNSYPNSVALTLNNLNWTYKEIDDKARQWTSALIHTLGRTPNRVGILAYRSEASYIGVIASLFAGAAFVPLNKTFPSERTRFMIEKADLDAIIVDKNSLSQFCEIIKDLNRKPSCVLLPDSYANEVPSSSIKILDQLDLNEALSQKSLPNITDDSLAYLLFTSGSTGLPKGVPITHSNAVHFLNVNQKRYQITPADRLTQTFEQTFDLSVFDLFMAWSNGATVCSMEPIQLLYPQKFIKENEITIWFSVPSVAKLLHKQNLLEPDSLPTLRLSLFCGEALPKGTVDAWQEAAPNSIIENLYGPTELTIACAVYRWDRKVSPTECLNEIVPIGQLYPGLEALVLDENLVSVPYGKEGELCVSGPQTFCGYWRDTEQTIKNMIKYESMSGEIKTYYRTGDRVLYLPSGNMTYLGRKDHQLKIQGYRVELSEIEGVLSSQPGVTSAVAFGWPIENGNTKEIIACMVGDVDFSYLFETVKKQLPSYMIPRTFYFLEEMPLNSNGKIDRKELVNLVRENKRSSDSNRVIKLNS